MSDLRVGVIGCGNISAAYFGLGPMFRGFTITACADLNEDAAKARAQEYQVTAMSVDALLASDDIDLVLNLTIPAAHYAVSKQALEQGKHVYSEKPLTMTLEEGIALKELADKVGKRVGSAPDTFLGGSHQLARHLIDAGDLGTVTGGSCHVMSRGMEHWHPNPEFFFKPGGGPILDLGPYYVANLINLIGPIESVMAMTSIAQPQRTVTNGPLYGSKIDVETPTTAHALLKFKTGAVVTLSASWDVMAHQHSPMELYGSKGSLYVPDPNFFGGSVTKTDGELEARIDTPWDHPFSPCNQIHDDIAQANYRTAGLADMALAIAEDRPHRCGLETTLHGLEVMFAILESGETGSVITLKTDCLQPEALGPEPAKALLKVNVTEGL